MSLSPRTDREYWRSRAKEARAVAVQMKDAHTKAVMLGIAQDYEKLAERAEQRAEKAQQARSVGSPLLAALFRNKVVLKNTT